MSYYTTVKVISTEGKPVRAEVACGGTYRGFTDPNTGEISFELSSNDSYSVSAKRMGDRASGKVNGGKVLILRLE
jgi:hypothetical protein